MMVSGHRVGTGTGYGALRAWMSGGMSGLAAYELRLSGTSIGVGCRRYLRAGCPGLTVCLSGGELQRLLATTATRRASRSRRSPAGWVAQKPPSRRTCTTRATGSPPPASPPAVPDPFAPTTEKRTGPLDRHERAQHRDREDDPRQQQRDLRAVIDEEPQRLAQAGVHIQPEHTAQNPIPHRRERFDRGEPHDCTERQRRFRVAPGEGDRSRSGSLPAVC
jgi:hypothetical protein